MFTIVIKPFGTGEKTLCENPSMLFFFVANITILQIIYYRYFFFIFFILLLLNANVCY